MHQKMQENQIVRVTEVEITEAAFAEGRRIVRALDSLRSNATALDAFKKRTPAEIRFITTQLAVTRPLEKQLLQAYLAGGADAADDNVQKVRNNEGGFDSLLYTKPVMTKLPDGKDTLEGVWSIWLGKKQLVMDVGQRK